MSTVHQSGPSRVNFRQPSWKPWPDGMRNWEIDTLRPAAIGHRVIWFYYLDFFSGCCFFHFLVFSEREGYLFLCLLVSSLFFRPSSLKVIGTGSVTPIGRKMRPRCVSIFRHIFCLPSESDSFTLSRYKPDQDEKNMSYLFNVLVKICWKSSDGLTF